jgi:hypothetical protein
MSIVYDYLKQIQAKKPPEKVAPEVPQPVKKKSGAPLSVKIAVGVLGCLLLAAGLYFFPPKVEKTTVKLYRPPEKVRAVQPETPDFGFLLEGIIYNPSRPFAILDGKMYETGGRIGDFEVVKITPDTVSLKNLKDGTSRTIRL